MAVTISGADLRVAIRVEGSNDDEARQITRLLSVASEMVTRYAPDAPSVIQNEAVILAVGYLYDKPNSYRFTGYADAFRNSGAETILNDYRVLPASIVGEV